ncbi:unnamed protein product [Protopolystoma xenopodis]|uniref:Uncharacterized protein n=1 Tax=Protopolystoma xenopodis TaxID=117903 RepID=A0A3S5BLW2_9PLAT|nr:unnamed protein product [Protopolystoma xenopodis]
MPELGLVGQNMIANRSERLGHAFILLRLLPAPQHSQVSETGPIKRSEQCLVVRLLQNAQIESCLTQRDNLGGVTPSCLLIRLTLKISLLKLEMRSTTSYHVSSPNYLILLNLFSRCFILPHDNELGQALHGLLNSVHLMAGCISRGTWMNPGRPTMVITVSAPSDLSVGSLGPDTRSSMAAPVTSVPESESWARLVAAFAEFRAHARFLRRRADSLFGSSASPPGAFEAMLSSQPVASSSPLSHLVCALGLNDFYATPASLPPLPDLLYSFLSGTLPGGSKHLPALPIAGTRRDLGSNETLIFGAA